MGRKSCLCSTEFPSSNVVSIHSLLFLIIDIRNQNTPNGPCEANISQLLRTWILLLGSHWHLKLDDRAVCLDIQKYWWKGHTKTILIPFRAMEKRVIVKQAQTLAPCKESSVAQENAQLILLSSSLEARPLPFLCLSISFLGQGASVLKWHRNNSCHSLSSGESPLICSFPSKCDPGDYNSWRFRSLFHFT